MTRWPRLQRSCFVSNASCGKCSLMHSSSVSQIGSQSDGESHFFAARFCQKSAILLGLHQVLMVQFSSSPCISRLKSNSIPLQMSWPLANFYTSSRAQLGTSQTVCRISLNIGTTMNRMFATLGWSLNIPTHVCIARIIGDTRTYFAFRQWTAPLFASHCSRPIGCNGVSINCLSFYIEKNSSDSSPCSRLIINDQQLKSESPCRTMQISAVSEVRWGAGFSSMPRFLTTE